MKFLSLGLLCSLPFSLLANPLSPSLDSFVKLEKHQKPSRIVIDNRVLANVNDQPISVMDVMRKMDTYFYRDYPHLVDSEVAKYQFYKANWKYVFDDMVNNQLIYEDAKNKKIEVTHGDVREQLDRLYGPEIITNLDKLGLSFDEAWQMTEKDLYVRRMMGSILYLKGTYETAPKDLISAYDEYIKNNRKPDQWSYRMISFRGPEALQHVEEAQKILTTFEDKKVNFTALKELLKERFSAEEANTVTLSDEFNLKDNEISENHKKVLEKVQVNHFSEPLQEVSRVDKKSLYRIFYVSQYKPGGEITFPEVEEKLKETLIQSKVDTDINGYIVGLRDRYGVSSDTLLPESEGKSFEPFTFE